MRIAIGSIMQESNTFSPLPSGLELFEANYLLRGEAVLRGLAGARVEIPGMLEVLREAGAEPVPLVATQACSGGPITRAAFDHLAGELVSRLKQAGRVDGVLLALHGALVVEDDPDAEGAILRAVREVVGPRVPIAASLDLHGHVTPRMVDLADILVGYSTYPHVDLYETGQKAARLLLDTIAGKIRPVIGMAKRPMILSPNGARTDGGPLKRLMDGAKALERTGEVLAASLFTVQPWLDVPDLGFAAVVVTNDDADAAGAVADRFASAAWAAREEFDPGLVPLDEAIRQGMADPNGPTAVGDAGDAPSGGAPGDSAAVLRALLARGIHESGREAYLTLVDPRAVEACARAGVGAEVTLPLGHSWSRAFGDPLTVTGRVRTLFDGRYRMRGPGLTGSPQNMGRAAVLAIGGVRVVLMSLPVIEWDPSPYLAVGLDPADAALVFAKSPSHFRVAYGPIARRCLVADTPGATRCDLKALTFTRVGGPLYPLQEA